MLGKYYIKPVAPIELVAVGVSHDSNAITAIKLLGLMQELILGSFAEKLKTSEIYYKLKEAVAAYLSQYDAA